MVGLLTPLQIIPGGPELVIILLIVALLFGASKIPKLARSTGEAMGEFQKGREQVEQELQEMRDGATGSVTETTAGTAEPAATGAETDAAASADDETEEPAVEEAERQ